jgi:hypothetical protein
MTFNPCDDCGTSLVPVLLFFWFAWSVPFTLAAIRRHLGHDDPLSRRLVRVQWFTVIMVALLSFGWVRSPWS